MGLATRPKNWYAGRGRMGFAARNVDGSIGKILFARNVSEIELSFNAERRDHFESESAQNLLDASFVSQKTAELRMVMDSLDANSAQLSLNASEVSLAAKTNATKEFPTVAVGDEILLDDVNLAATTNVSIADDLAAALTEDTHYSVDRLFGTIKILSLGAFTQPLTVTYDSAVTKAFTAFTQPDTNEYYVAYLATNKANNGKKARWDIYRVQVDPTQALAIAGDDFATFECRGRVLYDEVRDDLSEFGPFARAIWVTDIE